MNAKHLCAWSVTGIACLLMASCQKNAPANTPAPTPTPEATVTKDTIPAVTGHVTYTLAEAEKPDSVQKAAYKLIRKAMDDALYYMNKYTQLTKKLAVSYKPGVPTADANSNGSIRFGSNTSYMSTTTALHEIAHACGVGTTDSWWSVLLINGIYTGKQATAVFRSITKDSTSLLHGDSQHFWPYGLNYASEVSSTADYVSHCLILDGMRKDGLRIN